MAYTAETLKLSGGACAENAAQIVLELADLNITSSQSAGVVTVTVSSVTTGTKLRNLLRVAKAAGATTAYVPSTNV